MQGITKYKIHDHNFAYFQSVSRLTEPVAQINTTSDMESVTVLRESALPLPEQLLPDFYAEHTTLAMNRERRRQVKHEDFCY